jgi:UV excision repair protein RAD23
VASSTSNTNIPATPSPAPQAQQSGTPSARRLDDPSSLALGNERAEAIASMEAMGFPRDQIDRAMRAAFFNPDRAVEYLLSGIPEHLQRDDRPAAPPAAARSPAPAAAPQTADTPAAATSIEPAIAELLAGGEAGGDEPFNMFEAAAAQRGSGGRGAGAAAGLGGAGSAAGALEFLRNNPQFQQLRHLVQQQPQMLEPIMQQLAQGNPQLAAMIRSSPEEFLELLAEDNDDDAALPPGAQVVSISEEERDAIERVSLF